jgi:hypothetical protein
MDDDLRTRARDAAYTAVGFGVLGVQRLQVKRREVQKEVGKRVGGKAGVAQAVRRVEAVVDPVLDKVEKQLPPQGRVVMHTARTAGKVVQKTLLG